MDDDRGAQVARSAFLAGTSRPGQWRSFHRRFHYILALAPTRSSMAASLGNALCDPRYRSPGDVTARSLSVSAASRPCSESEAYLTPVRWHDQPKTAMPEACSPFALCPTVHKTRHRSWRSRPTLLPTLAPRRHDHSPANYHMAVCASMTDFSSRGPNPLPRYHQTGRHRTWNSDPGWQFSTR